MNLVVTNLNQESLPLLDYRPPIRTRNIDGTHTLSVTVRETLKNSRAFDLFEHEGKLSLGDNTYRIKQMQRDVQGDTPVMEITALHVFFDIVHDYQYDEIKGVKVLSLHQGLTHALEGTGIAFIIEDDFDSLSFENFGGSNCLKLFEKLRTSFGFEFEIENDTFLRIKKRIGRVTNEQMRWKHNIKTIQEEVDTTNLSTYIKGYGKPAEDEDGNVIEGEYVVQAEYTSPKADLYEKLYHADPVYDERFIHKEALLDYLKSKLTDKPELSYIIEYLELQKTGVGSLELGDSAFLIHEILKLDFNTRVVEIIDFPTLPNRKPIYTISSKKDGMTDKQVQSNIEKDAMKDDILWVKGHQSELDKRIEKAIEAVADVENAMKYVDEEMERIENEVIPEIEDGVNSVRIPSGTEPPYPIPKSNLWWDMSVDPPRLMRWNGAEWVILAPEIEDIDELIERMKEEAIRQGIEYTDEEVKAARQAILEQLAEDLGEVTEDIDEKFTNVNASIGGISTEVGEVKATVNEHTGEIEEASSKIGELEVTADEITSTVSDLNADVTSANKAISKVEQKADSIESTVTEVRTDLDGLDAKTGNLVKNPELTGSIEGWSGGTNLRLSVNNEGNKFDGELITALATTTPSNTTTYSDWFDVDPAKAYEVTVWVRKNANRGRHYFGLHASDGNSSNNMEFLRVNPEGEPNSESSNFYFYAANRTVTEWERITGYLMPSGTNPSDMEGLGTSNINNNAIMKPGTKQVRLRWLNHSNGGTDTHMYLAMPKVVEVSSDFMTATNSRILQLPDEIDLRVTAGISSSGGDNLIPDGSFENGGLGWKLHTRASVGTNQAHSGNKSLRIASGSGTSTSPVNKAIPVIAGDTYQISAWYLASSTANGTSSNNKIRVGSQNGGLVTGGSMGFDGAQSTWKRMENTFTIPSNVTSLQISIVANHTTGTVYWDDISLRNVTNTVDKTNVLSSINLSTEGIKIEAPRVDIKGLVSFINDRVNILPTDKESWQQALMYTLLNEVIPVKGSTSYTLHDSAPSVSNAEDWEFAFFNAAGNEISKANTSNNTYTFKTPSAARSMRVIYTTTNSAPVDIQATITEGTSSLSYDESQETLINGGKLVTNSVTAKELNIDSIFANTAIIGKIQSDIVLTTDLVADKIVTGVLNAAKVSIINLSASNITTGTLDGNKARIRNISAGEINSGILNAIDVYGSTITGSKFINDLLTIENSKVTVRNSADTRRTSLSQGVFTHEWYSSGSVPNISKGWKTGIRIDGQVISGDYQIQIKTNNELGVLVDANLDVAGNFNVRNGQIRGQGGDSLRIGRDYLGYLPTYDRTYSSNTQHMRVTVNGIFGRITSSRRYKLLEEPVTNKVDPYNILKLTPKTWYDKRAAEECAYTLTTGEDTEEQKVERVPGLIAEDVEDAGLDLYVSYNDDKQPDGLNENLWTLLIPIVKDLKNELEGLKNGTGR